MRKHTKENCWCNPRKEQICPECDDEEEPISDCWKCQGQGWVDAYDPLDFVPTIILHNLEFTFNDGKN